MLYGEKKIRYVGFFFNSNLCLLIIIRPRLIKLILVNVNLSVIVEPDLNIQLRKDEKLKLFFEAIKQVKEMLESQMLDSNNFLFLVFQISLPSILQF